MFFCPNLIYFFRPYIKSHLLQEAFSGFSLPVHEDETHWVLMHGSLSTFHYLCLFLILLPVLLASNFEHRIWVREWWHLCILLPLWLNLALALVNSMEKSLTLCCLHTAIWKEDWRIVVMGTWHCTSTFSSVSHLNLILLLFSIFHKWGNWGTGLLRDWLGVPGTCALVHSSEDPGSHPIALHSLPPPNHYTVN